jgi:hypothetical protein
MPDILGKIQSRKPARLHAKAHGNKIKSEEPYKPGGTGVLTCAVLDAFL